MLKDLIINLLNLFHILVKIIISEDRVYLSNVIKIEILSGNRPSLQIWYNIYYFSNYQYYWGLWLFNSLVMHNSCLHLMLIIGIIPEKGKQQVI